MEEENLQDWYVIRKFIWSSLAIRYEQNYNLERHECQLQKLDYMIQIHSLSQTVNLCFSVLRGYRNGTLAWNGLK